MSFSVNQNLKNKSILITGSTGFLGKVVVEKILRSCPEVNKIYLIIRKNAKQRIQSELLKSPIFDTLRSLRNDFEKYINSKLIGITGDILEEYVGINQHDLTILQNDVNIIIHCAASVDFRERLDNAIRENILGTLRLFEMAKNFKKLECFTHISTAYVNSHQPGYNVEEIPNLNFDAEELIQLIMQMSIKEIEEITPKLLQKYKYPNTYTFTKAITEKILQKKRGNIPLAFVRPSIVGCSCKEPVEGWVDAVNAIAAVILFAGVGLVTFLPGDHKIIADIIPVDVVANVTICAAASIIGHNELKIFHAGSSQVNPVWWYEAARWVSVYWRNHNVKKRVDPTPLKFMFYRTALAYNTRFLLKYKIPSEIYSFYAKWLGSPQQKKNAHLMKRTVERTVQANDAFGFFTSTEFVFDVSNTQKMMDQLIEEERQIFNFNNLSQLDWERYFRFFCNGVHRFVLKEDVKPPSEILKIDLIKEPKKIENKNSRFQKLFPDLAWAYKSYRSNIGIDNFNTLRTPEETIDLILRSPKIQEIIKKTAQEENVSELKIKKRAHKILVRMSHYFRLEIVRLLGWFLRKVWRKIYQGIHVDEKGVEMIREVLSNGPIVLIPTHRSYVDFLIVSYVFFEFDLPLPRIAAGEDFLGILFVNWVFRRSGAFFLRRSFKEDALYIALFTEYVQRLICDWSPIEFFIEGRRSRTGKSLNPKRGLLSICTEPFFEKKIPDLIMVPISISYEKVIEAELYSNELLGEQKTKESFSALIKASKILQMNFGRINVIFNQPISLKTYTEIFIKEINSSLEKNFNPFLNELDKKCLIQSLSYEIIQELNQGIVITTTSLVATVILAVRKGITHEDLITKVDWLREYISILGGMIAFDGTTGDLVDQALKLLSNLIIKIRNTYVPSSSVENGKQNKSILVLDYYRNQLVHLFINEGLIACVLFSYQKVKKDTLIDDVLFLRKLFAIEFPEKSYPTKEIYSSIIDSMTERNILLNNEDIISISENAHGHITFLCYMFWPLIDTYWLSSLSLFSLYPSHIIKKRLLIHRIQWIAEKMHSEGNLPFYESCSLEIINNTLDLFNNWKVIEYKNEENEAILPGSKRGQSRRKERKQPTIDPTEIILSPLFQKESELQNLVQNINKFRKCSTSLLSLQQNLDPITLRRLMISEFPVLSKL